MEPFLSQLINLGGFLGMLAYLAYNIFLKSDKKETSTPLWADELMQHFNHETTSSLSNIEKGQDKIIEKLDKMLVDGVKLKK